MSLATCQLLLWRTELVKKGIGGERNRWWIVIFIWKPHYYNYILLIINNYLHCYPLHTNIYIYTFINTHIIFIYIYAICYMLYYTTHPHTHTYPYMHTYIYIYMMHLYISSTWIDIFLHYVFLIIILCIFELPSFDPIFFILFSRTLYYRFLFVIYIHIFSHSLSFTLIVLLIF